MIQRIWHGWTSSTAADDYEHLLRSEIVPGILRRDIDGLEGIDILRRRAEESDDVEFVTIMTFDGWPAVEAFAGPGGTTSVVPPAARELLDRFDEHSQHYEVVTA